MRLTFVITILFFSLMSAFTYASNDTDFIEAVPKGNIQSVMALLEKGADVNAKNEYGLTALYLASQKGHTEIVKLLLGKRSDVNAKDRNVATASNMASQQGHTKTTIQAVRLEIVVDEDTTGLDKEENTTSFVKACETVLRTAGFKIVRTTNAPVLSIHAKLYKTG